MSTTSDIPSLSPDHPLSLSNLKRKYQLLTTQSSLLFQTNPALEGPNKTQISTEPNLALSPSFEIPSNISIQSNDLSNYYIRSKISNEYGPSIRLKALTPHSIPSSTTSTATSQSSSSYKERSNIHKVTIESDDNYTTSSSSTTTLLSSPPNKFTSSLSTKTDSKQTSNTLTIASSSSTSSSSSSLVSAPSSSKDALITSTLNVRQREIQSRREIDDVKPTWHAPWELMRVISSHTGWVRTVCVDHSNEWFATGSVDRTIKIFSMDSGQLRITLNGHTSAVRGLCVSSVSPYLFSVGEDKTVKCWDLHHNRVIHNYHGHLSGVYCCTLLESSQKGGNLNLLLTGGRDSSARVWDLRTEAEVAVLGGHVQTVSSIIAQTSLPQIVTGSHDTTMRLWDLRKTNAPYAVLTHHKKSIRSLLFHPTEYTFTSGAADSLKVWKCPEGQFLRDISGHHSTINTMTLNRNNVLVSGGDDGTMSFWDYKSGYSFQSFKAPVQPGSSESESGIFSLAFDQTGIRLITGEADKTIKIYKENPNATEKTHPINFRTNLKL
jgi:pleiotropic regulator 1